MVVSPIYYPYVVVCLTELYIYFADGRWQRIGKVLSQIDSGITDTPWGVDPSDTIYAVQKGNIRKVGGRLMHVSSGESGVWGVSRNKYLFP